MVPGEDPAYRVQGEGELLAVLEPPGQGWSWQAAASEGRWVISFHSRRGWGLDALDSGSERLLARYRGNRWRAGGRIDTLADGGHHRLRRLVPAGHRWRLLQGDQGRLLDMRFHRHGRERVELWLDANAGYLPGLALVTLVALSVVLLEERLAPAVAGDGGGGWEGADGGGGGGGGGGDGGGGG